MSSVIIQVGQCGNQVGHEFWKILHEDPAFGHAYYSADEKFRSVNIDCEPKVIRKLVNDPESGRTYRHGNMIASRKGCGSNWALGYYGNKSHEENGILDRLSEAVRKEIERCPSYSGTILMHSLAGGTGSGLGSLVSEMLRDEYPANYLLSCVVAPYSSGEITIQDYNVLLTLSTLQRYSDGIMLFDNDTVLQSLSQRKCSQTVVGKSDLSDDVTDSKSVSISQINRNIALCMAGLFLPTDSSSRNGSVSIGMEPWELVRSLCPITNLKFMQANRVSRKKSSWSSLATLGTSLLNHRQACSGTLCTNLSAVIVARGSEAHSFAVTLKQIEGKIKYVPWNPFPLDFWAGNSGKFQHKDSASLTVAANCSGLLPLLEQTIYRAKCKYDAGAYLHWYKRHGCSELDFTQAFDELRTVVDGYKEAIH